MKKFILLAAVCFALFASTAEATILQNAAARQRARQQARAAARHHRPQQVLILSAPSHCPPSFQRVQVFEFVR